MTCSIEELFDRIWNDLSVKESYRKTELAKSNLKALENYSQERLSTDQKLSCLIASCRLNRIIEREDVIRASSNKDVDYVYHLKEQTTLVDRFKNSWSNFGVKAPTIDDHKVPCIELILGTL